jgi:hypothetical protein
MSALTTPNASAVDAGVLLEALRADLEPWLKTLKGFCSVARDPLNVLELLAEAPAGFRVILTFDGDEVPLSQTAGYPPPIVRTRLRAIVSCNPGLRLARDHAILKGNVARDSLLAILATVRKRMMGYRWPTTLVHEGAMSYEGTRPYEFPEFLPFAAYAMTFSLVHVIPLPAEGEEIALEVD